MLLLSVSIVLERVGGLFEPGGVLRPSVGQLVAVLPDVLAQPRGPGQDPRPRLLLPPHLRLQARHLAAHHLHSLLQEGPELAVISLGWNVAGSLRVHDSPELAVISLDVIGIVVVIN